MNPILVDFPAEIVGTRIAIRPYAAGDGQAIFEAIDESRAELSVYMPWVPAHQTASDSETYARKASASFIERTDLPMAIWCLETGKFIGACGFHRIDWTVPCVEIGYWIRTMETKKGYATEATIVLTKLAFELFAAQRVLIRVDSDNAKSLSIPKRLGFVYEGTSRNEMRKPSGELSDVTRWSMTPEDFERERVRFFL